MSTKCHPLISSSQCVVPPLLCLSHPMLSVSTSFSWTSVWNTLSCHLVASTGSVGFTVAWLYPWALWGSVDLTVGWLHPLALWASPWPGSLSRQLSLLAFGWLWCQQYKHASVTCLKTRVLAWMLPFHTLNKLLWTIICWVKIFIRLSLA